MRLEVRKREVADAATLQKLVVEHVEGIEAGLSVIDSRLLLGHATIDLVAQDASGALVLIALGFRGDESMLLRIVDAYSWCLEYPESVQRVYPTLAISESRPPRVVFVMTRVPESFQRKVKQLSFPSVDAVELHYIDVNGVPAVYFDTVAQLRRAPQVVTDTIARPQTARVAAEPVRLAPVPAPAAAEPAEADDPMRLVNDLAGRIAANGRGAPATAPRVEAAVVEPSLRVATAARPELSVVVSTTQLPPAGEPTAVPAARPVIAGSSDVAAQQQRVSLASAMCHVIDASARVVGDEPEDGAVAVAVDEIEDTPESEPIAAVQPMVELEEPVAVAEAPAEPAIEPPATPVEAVTEPAVEEPAPVVEAAVETPAEAPEPAPAKADAVETDPNQKYPFSEAARAAQLAQDLGIQLPKEGALTRQWIDFLNQLAAK